MIQQAIVAARADDERPETAELEALAAAAGYDVADAVVQRRTEDPSTYLGQGTAERIAERAATTDVDAVIVDGALSPMQSHELGNLLPDGVEVLDRERLILDVFADQASTKAATLQVEYATLQYRLPHVRAELQEGEGNDARRRQPSQVADGEHRRIRDLRRRMDRIEAELAERESIARQRRQDRREDGFDLIAIVGYTNAGKSTLLHRLADDLSLADQDADHEDLDPVAAVEDRLFRTLETTTRRVTVDGRPTLATDTVGFVDDLSHDVVRSFGTTLGAARDADVVLLLADGSDDPETLAEKVRVSVDAIRGTDSTGDTGDEHVPEGTILPAVNKVDRLGADEIDDRIDAVEGVRTALAAEESALADRIAAPIPISALHGDGVDALLDRVGTTLPSETARLDLPNDGRTQSLLARAHETGTVERVAYDGDRVRLRFRGRPDVVERLRSEATSIAEGVIAGE